MKIFSDGDASVIRCAIEDAIQYNRLLVSSEAIPDCAAQPEDVRIAAGKVRLFEALRTRLERKGLNRRRGFRVKKTPIAQENARACPEKGSMDQCGRMRAHNRRDQCLYRK